VEEARALSMDFFTLLIEAAGAFDYEAAAS
jgi:hypothetical protein